MLPDPADVVELTLRNTQSLTRRVVQGVGDKKRETYGGGAEQTAEEEGHDLA